MGLAYIGLAFYWATSHGHPTDGKRHLGSIIENYFDYLLGAIYHEIGHIILCILMNGSFCLHLDYREPGNYFHKDRYENGVPKFYVKVQMKKFRHLKFLNSEKWFKFRCDMCALGPIIVSTIIYLVCVRFSFGKDLFIWVKAKRGLDFAVITYFPLLLMAVRMQVTEVVVMVMIFYFSCNASYVDYKMTGWKSRLASVFIISIVVEVVGQSTAIVGLLNIIWVAVLWNIIKFTLDWFTLGEVD